MSQKQIWTPERIRALRGELSKAEFARKLGINALTVYRWELEDGSPEARRPRGKHAERLVAYAASLAAMPVVPAPVSRVEQVRAAEPDPAELAELLPILERILGGELRRAEAELLAVLAGPSARSEGANALAQQALARCQLWGRGDCVGAFATLLPLLQKSSEGLLPASVELEVEVTAALVFSSADGRVFDPGKTSAHVSRAERLLGPHTDVQRFLLWMAQLLAAYLLNDPPLIAHVLSRRQRLDHDARWRVVRSCALEMQLIEHYFARRSKAAAASDFEELLGLTRGTLPYLHARALGQAVVHQIDQAADPADVLGTVGQTHAVCREGGVAVGVHQLFTIYAEGEAHFRSGRLVEAERAWTDGLRLADELCWASGTLPFFLVRLYLLTGRTREVRALAERVSRSVPRVHADAARQLSAALLAIADVVDGDQRSAALDRLDEAVGALGHHNAATFLRRNLTLAAATAAVLAGDAGQAERALRRAERTLQEAPAAWATAYLPALRAVLLYRAGRDSAARTLLEVAVAALEHARDQVTLLVVRRLLAMIDLRAGVPGAATAIEQLDGEAQTLGISALGQLATLASVNATQLGLGDAALDGGERPLRNLASSLQRLSARGATSESLVRELAGGLRELYPGSFVRLDELDSAGNARPLHREGDPSITVSERVELDAGGGRRVQLSVGITEPDSSITDVLAIYGSVAGLALEAAALRQVGPRVDAAMADGDELPDSPGFIAASPSMRQLKRDLVRLARSRSTIIITGESGAGKEVVARALHDLSVRAHRPYVAFNCAAVPRELFEGQLFGYRKGAYTGAVSDHPGVIRAAQGGTLFLDEIGELPLEVQPKLLRFIENGEVSPLGEQTTIQVDVRIIAATFRDLEAMVREGRFREDLFFRLQVVPICVPPLRERPEDVVALARFFVDKLTPEGNQSPVIAPDALVALAAHNWPGNVRELRNVIERSLAFEPWPAVLRAEHLRIG